MNLNNETAKTLKRDFPIFKNNPGLVYLDNAATSQRPKQVIRAISNFYEKENANPGRSTHRLAEKSMEAFNEARKTIAKFIGANPEEVVFTKNATESLNLLSYTILPLVKSGKNEILLTEMEHHSNLVPWQQLAKRQGFKLKFVKIKPDFTLDYDDLKQKLTNKTAIFAFTYISNVLGTVNDVRFLTRLAKQKRAITIIDAAQAVQHLKVDIKEIGCDFLVFSSHKMLGPTGIGILYGRKELLEKLRPFNFGGGMIKRVSWHDSEFKNTMEKFEAGTQNIGEAIAFAEAVKYIEKIGIENIQKWEKELTAYALKKLKEVPGIRIYNPGEQKSSSLVSFSLSGIHPHDIAELLNKEKIAIRAGHQCAMPLMERLKVQGGVCRASFSFYNTFEDIDKLTKVLKDIQQRFK